MLQTSEFFYKLVITKSQLLVKYTRVQCFRERFYYKKRCLNVNREQYFSRIVALSV